jgi:branched-chain amino acid transport system ATP-binding protein
MIEHVMEAIMPLADRVVAMEAGRLIAEGTPEEILRNQRVIEAYLGKGPEESGSVQGDLLC